MKEIKMNLRTAETGNSFYEDHFTKMCEMLESGEGIWLYCWCTGHTRCAMVTAEYERKLRSKYGDKLLDARDEVCGFRGFVLDKRK